MNSCETGLYLESLLGKFQTLYKRKAHLHHYTKYIQLHQVNESLEDFTELLSAYTSMNSRIFTTTAAAAPLASTTSCGGAVAIKTATSRLYGVSAYPLLT
eukprot:Filipodium_phascolosomae@DN6923_c0_g1_i1.p1